MDVCIDVALDKNQEKTFVIGMGIGCSRFHVLGSIFKKTEALYVAATGRLLHTCMSPTLQFAMTEMPLSPVALSRNLRLEAWNFKPELYCPGKFRIS